jgi:hypothetical protein
MDSIISDEFLAGIVHATVATLVPGAGSPAQLEA